MKKKTSFVMYNITTLRYNIVEYREVRREERGLEDGFTYGNMYFKKGLRWQ